MDSVIKLMSVTVSKDEYGTDQRTESGKEVFAKVNSVTRAEFFNAGRNGLNPSYTFTMFGADYNGETIVEYGGSRYAVYRTYATDDDYIELYVERQGGVNGN